MGGGRREQDIAGYFHVVKYLCIYYVLGAKYGFAQSTGLRCAKHGFVLHATIHGFACMDAKYKFEDNPWIALCKQLIAWFTRRFSLRY